MKRDDSRGASVGYAIERILLRIVLTALLIFFLAVCLPTIWNLFSPFIIALCIAALLEPVIRFAMKRLKMKRGAASAILVLLLTALFLGLLYWFCSFAVVQLIGLGDNAQSIVSGVVSVLQSATDKLLDMAKSLPQTVGSTIRSSLENAYSALYNAGMGLVGNLANRLLGLAAALPYAIVYLNFIIIATIFITNRYDSISEFLHKRRKDSQMHDSFSVLRRSAGKGMAGYVRVQLLFSFLSTLISTVFFQAVGFRYSFLIGLAAGLLELIPQFGCGVLYIPWGVICFIIGQNGNGWLVLGLYAGYSLLRRITEPSLLGSNLGVSPLLSLIGMFVGMRMGGVLGLVLGPIAMVILASAARSNMFEGLRHDIGTVYRFMTERWKRGSEEITNAEK